MATNSLSQRTAGFVDDCNQRYTTYISNNYPLTNHYQSESRMNFLSQLTGCFAQPCAENPSVAMVEAAYRHHGMDWRYINCEVAPEQLGEAVRGARAMGWVGFNCSLPHKVAVIEHLDQLGDSAKIIGAVTCTVLRDGQLIGENTDGKGFLQSLLEVIDPQQKRLVLLGAGGAARAIGVEVALAGAEHVTVVNRSVQRGEGLATLLNTNTPTHAEFHHWHARHLCLEGRAGEAKEAVRQASQLWPPI